MASDTAEVIHIIRGEELQQRRGLQVSLAARDADAARSAEDGDRAGIRRLSLCRECRQPYARSAAHDCPSCDERARRFPVTFHDCNLISYASMQYNTHLLSAFSLVLGADGLHRLALGGGSLRQLFPRRFDLRRESCQVGQKCASWPTHSCGKTARQGCSWPKFWADLAPSSPARPSQTSPPR